MKKNFEGASSEERVVFFSPHAVITPHAEFERLLATFFANRSPNVTVIGCNESFRGGCHPHLTVSEAHFSNICNSCVANRLRLDQKSPYSPSLTDTFLEPSDYEWVETEHNKVANLPIGAYSYLGIPLGRYWLFDIVLSRKSEVSNDPQELAQYRNAAWAGLLAFRLGKKIVALLKPTIVFVYSNEYSLNRSFSAAFSDSDTKVYDSRQNGPLHSRLTQFLTQEIEEGPFSFGEKSFQLLLRKPITKTERALIWRHTKSQITSRTAFTYSQPRGKMTGQEIRNVLGVPSGVKVASVLLSSPDEHTAAKESLLLPKGAPLERDFDWLAKLTDLAQCRTDVCFVFRLHPRMAPNRREGVRSPELAKITETLSQKAKSLGNLVINSPGDGIGIYDLALISDCTLSYSTSATYEMGLLGIPSIFLEEFTNPFAEMDPLLKLGTSAGDLGARLDLALSTRHNFWTATMHARLVASLVSRRNVEIRYSRRHMVNNLSAELFTLLSKATKRLNLRPISVYRGIRYLGDTPVRPRYRDEQDLPELLQTWVAPMVEENDSEHQEIKHLVWLRRRLLKKLAPFDGTETLFGFQK